MTPLESMEPLLLPTPRRMERLGGFVSAPREAVILGGEAAGAEESYVLRIGSGDDDSGTVVIEAPTSRGVARAAATLDQLRRQYGARLPRLRIEDAPAFASRGLMRDASRCRVPTRATMLEDVDLAASLKLNHLEYYTEHTFAYVGHETVWRDASPITPEDVREVDAAATARAVALGANQNCFGHMERWLRHPEYAALAETHEDFDFYGVKRRGPFSLCPVDENVIALVRDLLGQLLPCFSSGFVNIGCDETADVGHGRSAPAARAHSHGATGVYIDFVRRVAEIAAAHGATPAFWADVALRDAGRLADLPDSLVCLAWGYEPDSPFDEWGRRLSEAGRRFRMCPGTSSWRSVTGRTTERRGNVEAAIRAAQRWGAEGLLMTDWGDLGHRQQDVVAMPGIAAAAAASWTGRADIDPRAVSLHVFGDRSLRFASWLDELGDADLALRACSGVPDETGAPRPLRNGSALFEDMHPSGARNRLPRAAGPWRAVAERLESLQASRPEGAARRWLEEADLTVEMALFAARRGALRREDEGAFRAAGGEMGAWLEGIMRRRAAMWRARFREGGLVESLGHERALLEAWGTDVGPTPGMINPAPTPRRPQ